MKVLFFFATIQRFARQHFKAQKIQVISIAMERMQDIPEIYIVEGRRNEPFMKISILVMPDTISLPRHLLRRGHPEYLYWFPVPAPYSIRGSSGRRLDSGACALQGIRPRIQALRGRLVLVEAYEFVKTGDGRAVIGQILPVHPPFSLKPEELLPGFLVTSFRELRLNPMYL